MKNMNQAKYKIFSIIIILICLSVFPMLSEAGEVKITASDGATNDLFGSSVSVSGDYAIVGAYWDDDKGTQSGSAYIFKHDGTSWTQQTKITASDGGEYQVFGFSVCIFGDYAIVGAMNDDDNGTNSGSAYIFKRDGISWSQQFKLTANDGAAGDHFGYSVSVSGDYVIVGANGDDDNGSNSGSAYIFKRDGILWAQQAKLTAADAQQTDLFGKSVCISGDYAIVGAYLDDDDDMINSGSAYIFKRDGISWNQQTKITASDATESDCFGYSVSISGDYAIIGAHWDDDNGSKSGSAYIFNRDGTSWTQQAKITASDAASEDYFGKSVSIWGDYVIVGAYGDDSNGIKSGAAYIFKRNDTFWNQLAKITASDGAETDMFGYSVSISNDYSIIGAYGDDDYSGSAYIYNITNTNVAEISDPIDGSLLNSTSQTFMWNDSGANQYWLWIGTSEGDYDVYSGDQGTNTSVTVSDLPANQETLYVRLFSMVNGEWLHNDYTYTACDLTAEIQTPSSGSTLDSTTETFTWNDSGADGYWLWIGTTQGDHDVYSGNVGTDTSVVISDLPANGTTLYARLWTNVDGDWIYNSDLTYAACNMTAEIQSPAPGSALGATSETFTWNDTDASEYWLWVGTSEGDHDVYSANQGTGTSVLVSGLPVNLTLYVRLWSKVNSSWIYNDYTYTAHSVTLGEMMSPTPGSVLGSTNETFTWSDAGAEKYWLWIGISEGSNDIYSGGQQTNDPLLVTDLPGDGETLYFRLYSRVDGEWFYNAYTYTASSITKAEIQSPVPGSVLSSTTETFTWNNVGADQYWLWIGTTKGSNDIYSDNQGTNNSKLVTGLPDNGIILYVRLLSYVNGEWLYNDYTYTAVVP
ncbi:MAG: hypothetical protein GY749_10450 [Desulfobacteraceae bacterium]|nr:hypothetical protein [Desulfobacteraceae bacterium]